MNRAKRAAELEVKLRADLADGTNNKSSSSESEEEKKEESKDGKESKKSKVKVEEYDYSSGIESDNDVDLLVE